MCYSYIPLRVGYYYYMYQSVAKQFHNLKEKEKQ